MSRVTLLSGSYAARSLIAAAQRTVNLYPEANPADAAAPSTFYGRPGLLLWSVIPGAGGVRMMCESSNGVLFGVRGSGLYRYSAGSWVSVATLASLVGPVYAADNGISAVFTDGTTTAPTVNLSTFAASVMSGDGWYGSNFVDFLDGFFVFNRPGTQQFYITGAYDLTVDALEFASAESSPDILVRTFRDHAEVWMFGTKSTEVYANGGNADFLLDRISGATMEMGCAAPHSVCKLDNSLVWMGGDERGDAMVWRAQGYQPARISTHAIEEEFRKYVTIADATAYSYQQGGHSFYVLTFPTANKTWVYDASTLLWAERSWRSNDNQHHRVRDNCHAFYQRKNLVGDWENGNVYAHDLDTFTDNGATIVRINSFQHMISGNARQFFDALTVDVECGVATGSEPDPQMSLRWSDDGGKTWSTLLTRPFGKVGEYRARPSFRRLGMGRDRVFEVSTSANVRLALQGAFLDMRVGTS